MVRRPVIFEIPAAPAGAEATRHSVALVIICTLVYLVLSTMVLYYAIKATKIDPSDPIIYEQKLTEAQG